MNPESTDAEAAGLKLALDDRGDQEAGDDEEHVDSHEPAVDPRYQVKVKHDHQENSHGAQAIDVGAVSKGRCV